MYKEQLTAVLDMDGFLADFEGLYCKYFGDEHREQVNLVKRYPDKKDKIEQFVSDPLTYKNLRPDYEAIKVAQWLKEREQHTTVHIVSARPIGALQYTTSWLNKHDVHYDTLTVRRSKEEYILSLSPDIVVDDIISILINLHQVDRHATKLLWKRAWNAGDGSLWFPRINTLEEFQTFYNKVADENLLSSARRTWLA